MKSLLGNTKGAAVVETLVAFPVFFAFFSTLVQMFYLEVGSLTTQHAATVAARAAAVVAADDPKNYGGGGVGSLSGSRQTEVEEAVKQVLHLSAEKPEMRLSFSGGFGEGQTFTAKVEFDQPCSLPIGGLIVCGTSQKATIVREASGASQTAGYTYP